MKRASATFPLSALRTAHAEKRAEIRNRLADFSKVRSEDYFYELVYCLLTPQSSAVNAGLATALLRANGLQFSDFDPAPLLHQKEFYIRFHKTKGKHLVAAKSQYEFVLPRLLNGSSSTELRAWLVKNVKGLGWKEASHFLRNIGHRDLAILDRHILRNLVRYRVLRALPVTLTPARYLEIEKKFLGFSREVKIPMDELDLLFWSMETGEILK